MDEEIYYTDGIIKSIDLKDSEAVICSSNSISDDSERRYNLWLKEDGNVLSKEAKVIQCNEKISYKDADDEIKYALIQIALGKQKARFIIKENNGFELVNLVIINE
ncbi:hypothetical protein [Acetobacterium wieringae]|uniref:Uncharacterized protein n=1 Tax=Acetobacterium wieringae TaxID=52694 RepID=A0A1F2PEI2_9FIRM|nr:hypothetical protein [Acetobacterium wieringae]OFV69071.1 hypothetical protein ACWI_34670 [Acetobacterium wieringae]